MDFVSIDFETANEARSSPCSIGLVTVRDGRVVDKTSMLIRPKELYFNPFNVSIHGITEDDVRDQPEFPDVWEGPKGIRNRLENQFVVAHNAGFDMSVLRHTLLEYEIPFPEFDYSCTRIIAFKTWPGLSSYSLDSVAEMLSISFNHHDALEDALACAEIGIRACSLASVLSTDITVG